MFVLEPTRRKYFVRLETLDSAIGEVNADAFPCSLHHICRLFQSDVLLRPFIRFRHYTMAVNVIGVQDLESMLPFDSFFLVV